MEKKMGKEMETTLLFEFRISGLGMMESQMAKKVELEMAIRVIKWEVYEELGNLSEVGSSRA